MNQKTTEPSAAATRAAERIIAWEWRNDGRASITADSGVVWQLAAIIDRETGLPELLEACEGLVRSAGYESGECEETLRGAGGLRVGLVQLDAARAAIARATT